MVVTFSFFFLHVNSFIIKDRNVVSYLKFDKYFKENFLIHFLNNLDDLKNSSFTIDEYDSYENIKVEMLAYAK